MFSRLSGLSYVRAVCWLAARPNVLPNGGFENGMTGWTGAQIAAFVAADGVWGRTAASYSIASGTDAMVMAGRICCSCAGR